MKYKHRKEKGRICEILAEKDDKYFIKSTWNNQDRPYFGWLMKEGVNRRYDIS